MSLSPKNWGKSGWKMFHTVALGYPDNPTQEDKNNYFQYYNSLRYTLPCKKCRNNYSDHFNKYPLNDQALSSKTNLINWTIDMHNIVNYYTGKPLLSYPEAYEQIYKIENDAGSFNKYIYYTLLILVIIIIALIIYYLYRRSKRTY
ncbi:Erv1 / Alr family protein [Acanthamoeba polyphaga moumouvirus]|uniref:Sulfhydryl oxidase n=2 Tax=Moumouvirus TaxID=3080801 RepID=L7RG47_9VIRU|nr:Erv1 / Alr family protein [Acanthamoeba polyphaga moumouvirus]AEX62738.1 putative FAD-linked sulfhydryloxidase [Moumouvirus Monve]AGC01990.1 Erv1 / Alr family protein [Acanthamoeba polyphaga moumouvirus]AQN68357.1 erv1 / alr family protein [Saudi moumouvirus]